MQVKNIVIGCDHAGFEYKQPVIDHLIQLGIQVTDAGTYSTDSCDYPDYAEAACKRYLQGDMDLGILICGTGIGISIAANKIDGIRAACCSEVFSAEMCRKHNNANFICFGSRVVTLETALQIVDTFIQTDFEGGRHERRVNKIMALQ